jgi:hypothetical protein
VASLDELRAQLRRERTLTLAIKAIPKSSKNEIAGFLDDGTMKVKITAAPEKGRANAAICELLAEQFGVAKRNVDVIRGETSAQKQIRILL